MSHLWFPETSPKMANIVEDSFARANGDMAQLLSSASDLKLRGLGLVRGVRTYSLICSEHFKNTYNHKESFIIGSNPR